jgi:Carbonic anhydrase
MKNEDTGKYAKDEVLRPSILTAEEQAALTPDMVLEILKQGNQEFTNGELTIRNNPQRIKDSSIGQYPKAAIISCLDSRVPVEDVFHRGIGDIFVGRIAGNFVNEDLLGSLEFACKLAGAKLIVVLGHENCGAINSAIDNVKLGNLTSMLSKIRPAVEVAENGFSGEKTSKNLTFVHKVCVENVRLAINFIRIKSPILKEMEYKNEIKIVGGIYHLSSGRVDFIE